MFGLTTKAWRRIALGMFTGLLVTAPPAMAANGFVYASVNNSVVWQYSANASGLLTALSPSTVPTGVSAGGVVISPDGLHAYVPSQTGNAVWQYAVDPLTGQLSSLSPATAANGGATAIGVAITPDGKNVYVANVGSGTVSQYSVNADGTLSAKSPATVAAGSGAINIAITPDGHHAYVSNQNGASISQFSIQGDGTLAPLSPATVSTGATPVGLTVSPNGHGLYVTNSGPSTVSQYTIGADGTLAPMTPATVASGSKAQAIAVSPDGKSAYVVSKSAAQVNQYSVGTDGTLAPKSTATVPSGNNGKAVAVSADGKNVYVLAFNDSTVWQFSVGADGSLTAGSPSNVATGPAPTGLAVTPPPQAPAKATTTLTIQASSSVALGGDISAIATLAGGSSPAGTITFHVYGPGDTSCETPLTTGTAIVTGNGAHFSGNYTPTAVGPYRWTATYGGDGGNLGSGPTACSDPAAAVTVNPGLPAASTGAASSVTNTAASLAGTLTPNGAETFYTFEYGTSTSFGSISSVADAGSGISSVPVTGSLSGLQAGTTYYYRLVATSSAGTTSGAVHSFRTTGAEVAPAVATLSASAVSTTGATLNGTVNPSGQQTAFTFEYGTSTSFGSISSVVALDDADGLEPVSAGLSGLAPDTTYYYRLVATNATGTTTGPVMTFSTGPGGAPIATTGEASAVTATGATIGASVDAHGSPTAYTIEYGPTTSFGSIGPVANAGDANGTQSVSVSLSGLSPGTQYLYRVVATNANGTTAGSVHGFSTPAS